MKVIFLLKIFLNKKILQIILLSFIISIILFVKGKNNNFRIEKLKRNLITERNIKKICSYTKQSFYELYGDIYYIYYTKKKTKYVNYIIDFIKDNDSKYIKKYLPRIGIYLFFLALNIVFIFLWLSLCIYSCCCPCCCNSKYNTESYNQNNEKADGALFNHNNSNSKIDEINNKKKDFDNIENNSNNNNYKNKENITNSNTHSNINNSNNNNNNDNNNNDNNNNDNNNDSENDSSNISD